MQILTRKTARQISHEDILGLVEGTALAIHVPGFVPEDVVAAAREKVIDHPEKGGLSQDTSFQRIGFAYSEISDEASRDLYHAQARDNIQRMRDLFAPYASPSDTFRAVVDEAWNAGASLLDIAGRKAFIGICRFQDKGVDLNPHTDALERNLPADGTHRLAAQLSANIYLNIPRQGGELELWGTEPGEDAYNELKGERVWGLERDQLGPPKEVIKPEPGDLLLLNPRQIHAVRPSSDEPRVTLGHFLGFYGPDRPLALWS
ncbi:2OG-Fe(II) oxygenase [Streptomyces sp. NPDC087440]|uniref:2OG-Fe(II)-dependent halogenase WelO5 family protein n=1 Tax=Streptomyces sp. NPDC087440 TaxID=3365790 RepID=UPI0037F88016